MNSQIEPFPPQGGGFQKVVMQSSFDWTVEEGLSALVDDPDVFRKTASSRVVHEWGEIKPIPGHSLIHLIALGDFEKVGCNRNGDAFMEEFCRRVHPTFVKNAALYRNHKTRIKQPDGSWFFDPDFKEGFVVKSAHNDEMGRTEVLVAANHEKCADWLGQLEAGDPVAFSMGFNCFYDSCSICGHKAPKPADYCDHVHKKKARAPYGLNRILPDGRKCYVINEAGYFDDISKVGTGADMTAFDLRKVASLAEAGGDWMSGADLAEFYARTYCGAPSSPKAALFDKLAEMEKRIMALGTVLEVPGEEIDDETAGKLASAPSNPMLYRHLADRGVVLSPEAFMKVATHGQDNPAAASAAKKLAAAGGGFAWAQSQGLGDYICSISTYDPGPSPGPVKLAHHQDRALVAAFSVRPGFAQAREMDRNLKIGTARSRPMEPMTEPEKAMACEYLAYKVAALLASGTELTDEVLLGTIL